MWERRMKGMLVGREVGMKGRVMMTKEEDEKKEKRVGNERDGRLGNENE